MKTAALRLALVLLSGSCLAAETYDASKVRGAFMSLGAGARPIALGEAYTAIANDASALSWNPGGLGQLQSVSAVVMHDSLDNGMALTYVAGAVPLGGAVVGAGLTALSYGEFDLRDAIGRKTGTESLMDFAGVVSVGFRNPAWLSRRGWSGVSAEFLRENSGELVFAAGAGSIFAANSWLRFGWALQHAGPADNGRSLPMTVKIGGLVLAGSGLQVAADTGYFVTSRVPWAAAGVELVPYPQIALRLGYKWRQDTVSLGELAGMSAGVGLVLGKLRVDYALRSYGDLGSSHRISMVYGFGADKLLIGYRLNAERIRGAIQGYIEQLTAKGNGLITIKDKDKRWTLKFIGMRKDVLRHRETKVYVTTAAFDEVGNDAKGNRAVDVDFWLQKKKDGKMKVVKARISAVDGKRLFNYKTGTVQKLR